MGYLKKFSQTIKKWNEILTPRQKKKSLGVLLVIIISSVFEMLGVTIVIPYINVLLNIEAVRRNSLMSKIITYFGLVSDLQIIALMTVCVIVVYIIKDAFLILSDFISLKYENDLQRDLSVLMLKSYMLRPYEDTLDINSAEALRGVSSDITGIYYIIQSYFSIASKTITIVLIGGSLLLTDPFMAMALCIVAGIVSFFVVVKLKGYMTKSGVIFNDCLYENTKAANHAINGIKEITVMNRNKTFVSKYEEIAEEKCKTQLKYRFLQHMPNRVIEAVFIAFLMIFLLFRLNFMSDYTAFIPSLSVMAVAAVRILPYISSISGSINTILFYVPSFENAYQNISRARVTLDQIEVGNGSEESLISFNNCIRINDLCFKYRRGKENVLSHLNMEVRKGEAIGIVGGSGEGKSTLADVILGLLAPQSGSVEVDGKLINSRSSAWANFIGYIPQNVFLLDDTIRNNILFGLEENEKTDSLIEEAIKKAQLQDVIDNLPDGLNTMVGERGVRFSGGQRQRIAIARVLYHNPEVIIMDEATSALDGETEAAVMEAIEGLHGSKTLIIIAHRVSTLKECDRIYKIERGNAVEIDYQSLS